MKMEENGIDEGYPNFARIKKLDTSWRRLGVVVLALVSIAAVAAPETTTNTLDMPLVRIPAGEFMMGSDESPESLAADYPQYDRERFLKLNDEAPVHGVRITRDFYFGKTEVTVGQFRRFVEQSGYVPESVRDGTGGYGYNRDYDPAKSARGDAFEGRDPKYSWRNPGFAQGDDHPVTNVTWNDAVAMAEWLSAKEGVRYRLPTEAEWEYACRAAGKAEKFGGEAPPEGANTAEYADEHGEGSVAVGAFAPNALGLHDMSGNLWEWVSDVYAADAYEQHAAENPHYQAAGPARMLRGGGWSHPGAFARCSKRHMHCRPSARFDFVGFRLVLEEQGAAASD